MRVTPEGLVVAAAAIGYLVLFNESKVELVAVAALAAWAAWQRPGLRFPAVGAIAAGAVAVWAVLPAQANARLELWFNGLAAWLDKPLLGWGLGSFEWGYGYHRFDFSQVSQATILNVPNVLAGAAHNAVVQTLVELGLIGFSAALVVIWMVFRLAGDANAKVALAMALAAMMVGFPDHNPFTAALIAVAAGIVTRNEIHG